MVKKEKMVHLGILVPESLKANLESLAEANNRSLGGESRVGLENHVQINKKAKR